MSNIKFNPWVGENYTHSKYGKRVLVLGESHYCANAEEAVPTLTNDIITDLFDSESEFEPYKNPTQSLSVHCLVQMYHVLMLSLFGTK